MGQQLEGLAYESPRAQETKQTVYRVGDLENLSATALYYGDGSSSGSSSGRGGGFFSGFGGKAPSGGGSKPSLNGFGGKAPSGGGFKLSLSDFENLKELAKKYGIVETPLMKSNTKENFTIRDFPSSGFQFHVHENNGIISGGKIKPYNGTKNDEMQLDNYQIAMGNLYADLLELRKKYLK